jgi:hypothetical protein
MTVVAVAAIVALSVGCKETKSPTEPIPTGNIVGAWTGTYNGISHSCSTSAQASYQQTGSAVQGTMTVPCLAGQFPFTGTLQGNTLTGNAMWGDPEFYPVKGTLSGSTLEITIFNDSESGGSPMGQMHLHR